jgi:GntR family transcriptional regulator
VPIVLRPNPSLGVPIYLQLMEQVKHAVETGAVRPGEQLPGIRPLAESLVVNPNTVAKAYRELEHEGFVELRQGTGAFISMNLRTRKTTTPEALRAGQRLVADTIDRLRGSGLSDDAIRRLVEGELAGVHPAGGRRG